MAESLFDLPQEYDEMLSRGLSLTGESKAYFIRGRIKAIGEHLPKELNPTNIVDFGCGTGDTCKYLRQIYPGAHVTGLDASPKVIDYAEQRNRDPQIHFGLLKDEYTRGLTYDLGYVNGVFHHVNPSERVAALQSMHRLLKPSAFLCFFENNLWNPGTRMVMRRVPFDREAKSVTFRSACKILCQAQFKKIYGPHFLFYFPRYLSVLRFVEKYLVHLPFGAQYLIIAQR